MNVGYESVLDIINALKEGEIQGVLLDTYIAGEFQSDLRDYKLQEILDHVFVYGVVLVRDSVELEQKFRSYLERKQSSVYATISQVVKPLKVSEKYSLCEKWPCSEFFWSVFSSILTEYGEVRSISPYSVQMRENTDQKNSKYGLPLRIYSKCGKIRTRKTPNMDTFHAVILIKKISTKFCSAIVDMTKVK